MYIVFLQRNVIYMKNVNPKEFVKFYCIKSLVCSFSGGRSSLAIARSARAKIC